MKEPPRFIETTTGIVTISIISVATALSLLAVGELMYREPQPIADHPILFHLYDYEWAALSAVGTIAAAVVAGVAAWIAIRQPGVMLERQRKQAAEDAAQAKKDRLHEATGAVFDAIDIYVDAMEAMRASDYRKIIVLSAKAEGMAGLLNILATNTALSDGAIFSCVNARVTMRAVINAGKNIAKPSRVSATALNVVRPVADAANKRALAVRADAKIRPRRAGNHKEMPLPLETGFR